MSCDDHGPELACEREGLDTDGWGFAHPSTLKGRTAALHCRTCWAVVPKPDVRWSRFLGKFARGLPWQPHCRACWAQHADDFDPGFDERLEAE